jgi:hypothetical protein
MSNKGGGNNGGGDGFGFDTFKTLQIGTELCALLGIGFYFHKKNTELTTEIAELKKIIEQQSKILNAHEGVIRQLVQMINGGNLPSPPPPLQSQQQTPIPQNHQVERRSPQERQTHRKTQQVESDEDDNDDIEEELHPPIRKHISKFKVERKSPFSKSKVKRHHNIRKNVVISDDDEEDDDEVRRELEATELESKSNSKTKKKARI